MFFCKLTMFYFSRLNGKRTALVYTDNSTPRNDLKLRENFFKKLYLLQNTNLTIRLSSMNAK